MTTPARQTEADRVELVYYWALGRLGNALAIDSRELWNRHVSREGEVLDAAEFLRRSKQLVKQFRAAAQELAVAYYRLVRALRTGATIATATDNEGDTVSLESLRQSFEAVVDDIETQTANDPVFDTGEQETVFTAEDFPAYEPGDDNDVIEVEVVADVDERIAELDKAAEAELDEALTNLGLKNLQKKIREAEKKAKRDAKKGAEKRSEARTKAGNRQAAAAMRIMLNAARGLVYDLSETDMRLQGWVRYSKTGDPCGFCAMLISRRVMYRTRSIALIKGDRREGKGSGGVPESEADKYHDNCQCTAIPIFDTDQYKNSPLYSQNEYYAKLWDKHIHKKYYGDEALNKWRTLLRERQKDNSDERTQAVA